MMVCRNVRRKFCTRDEWHLDYSIITSCKNPVGCKYDCKINHWDDETIDRYKACLVIKEFTQIERIDFKKTFARVRKLVTIQCLLTMVIARNWEIHQMDVHNTFLYGGLEKEVYQSLPPGFSSAKRNVSRLWLWKVSRNWIFKFTDTLQWYGFVQSNVDLFTLARDDLFLAILVYVDDMLVVGNNLDHCIVSKHYLDAYFCIKYLESLKYFLGIRVTQLHSNLFVSQYNYVLDILTECGLLGSCPTYFPIEQQHNCQMTLSFVSS